MATPRPAVQASFFVPTDQQDSNRDQLDYQTDYSFAHWLTALFGFRYENERGSFVTSFEDETVQRRNFGYTLQLQGEIKGRLFYSAGGGVERRTISTGSPGRRAWASLMLPVRPGEQDGSTAP